MKKNNNSVEEQRKYPIIEECEYSNHGEIKHEFMLSMNGMYISGITHGQLKELLVETQKALGTK